MTPEISILPIVTATNERVGRLESFSAATLADASLIELIRLWRYQHRQFFLTQFEETTDKTLDYVRKVLTDQTRMMFFIYTLINNPADLLPVGHLGVTHLDQSSPELDNLLRGRPGGNNQLIYWAEVSLLRWLFQSRQYPSVCLRVLSNNWLAIRLHARIGFKTVGTVPLMRWEAAGEVHLQPYVDGMTSGELVKASLLKMELTAKEFLKEHNAER